MRTRLSRVLRIALTLAVFSGAATEKSHAQYARRTPVVDAVQKTRAGIVSVKVEKGSNWGRREVVGTGVVVDGRGYVLTNNHVVTGAERITVVSSDNGEHPAKLFAEDAFHDLAILTLPDCRRLPELSFAPSSDLMVGETVIAVGHPYGYTNTVSTGIVSALGREITMPSGETLTNLIQTDASINPGNSGGPLLNINGELVGINVAIREGARGIAFALPAEEVQRSLAKYLSAAKLARVTHGLVCGERVPPEGPVRQRVVVEQVTERSPASRAGFQKGDTILRIGDRPVSNRFDVERALWSLHPGDTVDARVLRDGQPVQTTMTLGRSAVAGDVAASGITKPNRPTWAVPVQAPAAKDSP
jgi:serine protease Do